MKSTDYKDLIVWKKSVELATWIYEATRAFPKEEMYGITSQTRRAAVSVFSNIAEGQSRQHRAEFIQFLYIAKGLLAELETQMIIAEKLRYINENDLTTGRNRLVELNRLLSPLIRKLKT